MKKYINPLIEIVDINKVDVIATSCSDDYCGHDGCPTDISCVFDIN